LTKISVGSIEKLIQKLHEITGIVIKRIPAAKLGSGGSSRPKAFVGVRTTTDKVTSAIKMQEQNSFIVSIWRT
jgi:hypothetical protein